MSGISGAEASRFMALDGIVIDTVRHRVIRDGGQIPVEPRVIELFAYLAAASGRIVSKKELMAQVWRARVVDDAVHRAVSLLRAALGDSSRNPRLLETVPRHGYRLLVQPAAWRPDRPPTSRRWSIASVSVAAVVLAGVIGLSALPERAPAPPAPPPAVGPGKGAAAKVRIRPDSATMPDIQRRAPRAAASVIAPPTAQDIPIIVPKSVAPPIAYAPTASILSATPGASVDNDAGRDAIAPRAPEHGSTPAASRVSRPSPPAATS